MPNPNPYVRRPAAPPEPPEPAIPLTAFQLPPFYRFLAPGEPVPRPVYWFQQVTNRSSKLYLEDYSRTLAQRPGDRGGRLLARHAHVSVGGDAQHAGACVAAQAEDIDQTTTYWRDKYAELRAETEQLRNQLARAQAQGRVVDQPDLPHELRFQAQPPHVVNYWGGRSVVHEFRAPQDYQQFEAPIRQARPVRNWDAFYDYIAQPRPMPADPQAQQPAPHPAPQPARPVDYRMAAP